MRRNYHRKLSASIYHHAKNVGIIGILTYQKIKSKRKRGNRRVPLPFRGKRAENCSYNVGKSLKGKGALIKSSKDVKTEFFLWDVEELTVLIRCHKDGGTKIHKCLIMVHLLIYIIICICIAFFLKTNFYR